MAAPMGKITGNIFIKKMVQRCLFLHKKVRLKHFASVLDSLQSKQPSVNATVRGWVKSIRDHKDLVFLHINDGSSSTHLQIICSAGQIKGNLFGSCVEVNGKLVESPGKGQALEMQADSVNILGECDPGKFPFKARIRHPPDFVRKHIHLRPKTNSFAALLRIRNAATQAIHQYFQDNGYCQVHTPIITSNDCEDAGEVFCVEPLDRYLVNDLDLEDSSDNVSSDDGADFKHYFKNPAFLTVSGQLHLETINGAFSKVYTFGPTFRAENSMTRNHLSEFYMVEAEIAFIQRIEELMVIMEDLIKKVTERVKEKCPDDMNLYFSHVAPKKREAVKKMLASPFMRLSYTDAIELLLESGKKFEFMPAWGDDLRKEHERFLTKYFGDMPVFVTEFPAGLKPFYAKLNKDTCHTAAAVDLLFPEVGEVFGGTLREDDLSKLENRLRLSGNIDSYQWYLDLRRYGSAPHGGFGMGFERYLQYLLGVSNIRDVIPFPRWPKHCKM